VTTVLPEVTVEKVAGSWVASLAERWNVGRNQNGGVVLAAACTALSGASGQPDPITITGNYLRPTAAGIATIRPSLIRQGRTTTVATAELWQDDKERLRVLGTFGDLNARTEEAPAVEAVAPAIPAPDDCVDLADILVLTAVGERARTRSLSNYIIRVHPTHGWGVDEGGHPSLSGWLRFRDEDTVTTQMLVAVADGFPPTVMSRIPIGWLPTVELTVHVLAVPAPDEPWLRAELRTRTMTNGLVDEDGELWDATGRLVARFRQLGLIVPRNA
jgi:acyl-coenzyme A thioesterase PaaI-like protein